MIMDNQRSHALLNLDLLPAVNQSKLRRSDILLERRKVQEEPRRGGIYISQILNRKTDHFSFVAPCCTSRVLALRSRVLISRSVST